MSGPFNPHWGQFGTWPTMAPSSLPTIVPGSAPSSAIGYLQGILFWKANQNCRPQPNPGPYGYGPVSQQCVRNFKAFFGIPNPTSATVDLNTWNMVQYIALNLPNRSL